MIEAKKRKRSRPADALGTTARRLRFIDEYMIDRNAHRSAIRAGYSPKIANVVGPKILALPEVLKEVDRRTKAAAEKADTTVVDILRDLKRIATFDVRELFTPDGKMIVNPRELPEEIARGLVNFDIVVLNKDGDYVIKLNPGNRLKAIELLGKYHKMWTEKIESRETRTVQFTTDFGDDEAE